MNILNDNKCTCVNNVKKYASMCIAVFLNEPPNITTKIECFIVSTRVHTAVLIVY